MRVGKSSLLPNPLIWNNKSIYSIFHIWSEFSRNYSDLSKSSSLYSNQLIERNKRKRYFGEWGMIPFGVVTSSKSRFHINDHRICSSNMRARALWNNINMSPIWQEMVLIRDSFIDKHIGMNHIRWDNCRVIYHPWSMNPDKARSRPQINSFNKSKD